MNMQDQKRPIDAVSAPCYGFKTPEKSESVVRRQPNPSEWGVDETCQFLQREGLEESLLQRFRGRYSVVESWYWFVFNLICEISDYCHPAQKITGVGLRSLTHAELEKIGIK